MALTASQISSRLFKKSLNAGETLVTRQFFEEPRLGGPFIFSEQIWSESGSIPSQAPVLASGASSGVVQYFEKELLTHVSGSSNLAYYSANLMDSIPFNYGTSGTYNYQLYKNDGTTAIAFGEGDWLVDNSAGLLTFYGTLPSGVSSVAAPRISFYKYVGSKGVSAISGTGGGSGTSGSSGSSGTSGTSGIGATGADGTSGTSGVSGSGASQSLQETLAIGNDLGTFSIVRQGTIDNTKKFYISSLTDDLFISSGTVSGATSFEGGSTLRMGSDITLNNGSDGSAGTPGFNFRITKTNLVISPPAGGGTFLYGKTWFPITGSLLATDTSGYVIATASPTLEKTLTNGNTTGNNQILLATGSSTSPSISFEGDSDTGFYKQSDNSIGVSNGGTQSIIFNPLGIVIPSLPNTFLATDANGQIIATAASGAGGSSGTSGTSGTSGGGTGSGGPQYGSFALTLDGQGGVVSTGQKGYLQIQYDGQITGYSIIADPIGSVSFDVWIRSGALPTVSNSIVGNNYPELTNGVTFSTTTLTGWQTSFTASQFLGWNVRSSSGATYVRLELTTLKS